MIESWTRPRANVALGGLIGAIERVTTLLPIFTFDPFTGTLATTVATEFHFAVYASDRRE